MFYNTFIKMLYFILLKAYECCNKQYFQTKCRFFYQIQVFGMVCKMCCPPWIMVACILSLHCRGQSVHSLAAPVFMNAHNPSRCLFLITRARRLQPVYLSPAAGVRRCGAHANVPAFWQRHFCQSLCRPCDQSEQVFW